MYLLGFLIGYCIIKRLKYQGIPENFPPGPPCIPLLGSAPFIKVHFGKMTLDCYDLAIYNSIGLTIEFTQILQGSFKESLEKWREDYGDVVGLKLGSELTVVLSDYDVINR